MRRFVSVLKQKVFIRRPGNFLGNIPRHTASQRKKLQGARTTKAVAILMLQQVNFYFAGCRYGRSGFCRSTCTGQEMTGIDTAGQDTEGQDTTG